MKKSYLPLTLLMAILALLCFIVFDILQTPIIKDDVVADGLLTGSISRLTLCLLFGWLFYLFGGRNLMTFTRQFFRNLKWALPCLMVAIINFPFHSLITGGAHVIRTDLIWLYAIYIISIALLEEFVFRGSFLIFIFEKMKYKKMRFLWTTVICSLVFSLIHLTNLFDGRDISTVLLQCAYTFLIGAMLTVTMFKLKNIWLCVLLHAIFDFGGFLIIYLGTGEAWDRVFWILTIVSGLLCAGHVIFSLIKLDRDYVQ